MATSALHDGSLPRRRPGRPRKGDREQLSCRVPRDHKAVYEAKAAAEGLFLGDYVAVVMARAHALGEPDYLAGDPNQPSLLDTSQLKKTG